MSWRVARSLDTLLGQLNGAFPGRSKASDGAIGDTNHLAEGWTNSDHNPWYPLPNGGVVTARDITHDPAHGVDIDVLSDQLAASRDPRIKYVIANGMILDSRSEFQPWTWQPYHGVSPHREHLHLSVMASASCDDTRPWDLPMLGGSVSVWDEKVLNLNGEKVPAGLILSKTEEKVTQNRTRIDETAAAEIGFFNALMKKLDLIQTKIDNLGKTA